FQKLSLSHSHSRSLTSIFIIALSLSLLSRFLSSLSLFLSHSCSASLSLSLWLVRALSVARSPLAQSLFLHWFYCLQKGLLFKSFIKLTFHFDACVFLILSVLDRIGVRLFFSCWVLLLLIYFS
ncbi:unnamed protein product, partial [Prunus brigantina]